MPLLSSSTPATTVSIVSLRFTWPLQALPSYCLYAAILKDASLSYDLSALPVVVSLALMFVSVAGYAVLKIVVQLRFSAVLYIRAMNGIRKMYAEGRPVDHGLLLPVDPRYPAYCEGPRWRMSGSSPLERDQTKYMYEVIRMMAFANAIFLAAGIHYFPRMVGSPSGWDIGGPVLIGFAYFIRQMHYYFRAARAREVRGQIVGRI